MAASGVPAGSVSDAMMSNNSGLNLPTFILTGLPGLKGKTAWVGFLLFPLWVSTLLGNRLILFAIKTDRGLHQPMCLFLCILACSDLGLSVSTFLTTLSVYWFGSKDIGFNACITQRFFIHAFQGMESGTLLAKALDRVVAIREPLRYQTLFPNAVMTKIGVAAAARSISVCFPVPFLIKRLPFHRARRLSHPYCLHPDVMKLACADIEVNVLYGLILLLLTMGFDVVLILAYVVILKTVLAIASRQGHRKALNTCVSHVCALLIFYVPMISLSLLHRYREPLAPLALRLMASLCNVVPPLLNPVVYSMKTQQIRQRMNNLFPKKQSRILR